jgi:hypothetical protein
MEQPGDPGAPSNATGMPIICRPDAITIRSFRRRITDGPKKNINPLKGRNPSLAEGPSDIDWNAHAMGKVDPEWCELAEMRARI